MRRTMLVAAILLILAAGLIYAQYRSDLSIARRELQAGSQITRTECGPAEYAVAGSGPAVLVIHGAGGGYSTGVQAARTGHSMTRSARKRTLCGVLIPSSLAVLLLITSSNLSGC